MVRKIWMITHCSSTMAAGMTLSGLLHSCGNILTPSLIPPRIPKFTTCPWMTALVSETGHSLKKKHILKCSKPNHPVEDYTFDSSDNVLPPYSLYQSNGKYHISDLFEKGYPTLPPTFSTPITIWIQSLSVHPLSASFLPMMLPLPLVTLSLIRLTPLFSPKVMLSMIMTTTPITMMMMILHHPKT